MKVFGCPWNEPTHEQFVRLIHFVDGCEDWMIWLLEEKCEAKYDAIKFICIDWLECISSIKSVSFEQVEKKNENEKKTRVSPRFA